LYPSFSPSGVELFVASAINAATATIPSIVAAAYNQQQCPVCVAAICQQPTASTVSACGNCIHHHHLHTGI
jgi:hypothetical protein